MIHLGPAHVPAFSCGMQSLAKAWRITTTQTFDGAHRTWRLTDCGHTVRLNEGSLVFGTYDASAIAWGGPTRRVSGLRENTSELRVQLDTGTDPITEADVESGLLSDALVVEFLFDPLRPWLPPIRELRWRIAYHDEGRPEIAFELVGLSSRLKIAAGIDIGPTCRNRFFDSLCNYAGALTAGGVTGFIFRDYLTLELDDGNTRRSFRMRGGTDAFPPASLTAADWWAHGLVRFVDGPNAGVTAVIESNTQPVDSGAGYYYADVILATPVRYQPESGDALEVQVGCPRTPEACRSKFSNLANYRGAPEQPGTDSLTRTPDAY